MTIRRFFACKRCEVIVSHLRANREDVQSGSPAKSGGLEERKGRLQHLLSKLYGPGIQLNEHIEGDGATILKHACKLSLEGIVSVHAI
jgi:hypothetical protein